MTRRNPMERMQRKAERAAQVQSVQPADRLAVPSTDSGHTGASDPVTGEWVPYGRFDLSPFSEFGFSE